MITTLYRAKKAEFSASNSLMSFDLAAAQYGSKKEVAGVDDVKDITDYTFEILNVADASEGKLKLAHTPIEGSLNWVYTIENNEIGTAYEAKGSAATATTAAVDVDGGNILLPTDVTTGKVYVEYKYKSTSAVRVVNRASEFPEAVSVVIYAYFRDVCNENKIYSGKIVCPKAKLNPESVELALTSTGKHPFSFVINRDYCAEEGEDTLFEIILASDKV